MKLTLSQSRVGTEGWGSITGLWGSSEVRGSQPSHSREMWPQGRGGEEPKWLWSQNSEPGIGPGQADGWRDRSLRNRPAQGAQGAQGLLHQSRSQCGWSRPRLRGWCKGKAAKQEGRDIDVWWPRAPRPVEEGRWGGLMAASSGSHKCRCGQCSAPI